MKLVTVFIGLIGLASAKIYIHPDAAAECGELGVMEWELDDLEPGYDITKLRKCREHPVTLLKEKHTLEKRKCYNGPKQRGCDKGYCWGKCNRGIKGA
ncbi:hypothetical protein ACHAPT_010352 [Fusarium lateritium]